MSNTTATLEIQVTDPLDQIQQYFCYPPPPPNLHSSPKEINASWRLVTIIFMSYSPKYFYERSYQGNQIKTGLMRRNFLLPVLTYSCDRILTRNTGPFFSSPPIWLAGFSHSLVPMRIHPALLHHWYPWLPASRGRVEIVLSSIRQIWRAGLVRTAATPLTVLTDWAGLD